MSLRFRLFGLLALGVLLLAAGCERGGGLPFAAEESDSDYERGQELKRQGPGRSQEALAAFLKVIAKRGDAAPESYLEAGLLYQQYIHDPIAAIYFFRKYLELQPNSPRADLVRQRIDLARRDFARTLPGHLEETANSKFDAEQLERLQRENDQLKAELAALRSGLPADLGAARIRSAIEITPPVVIPITESPAAGPAAAESSPVVRTLLNPAPAAPPRAPAAANVRPQPPTRPGASAPPGPTTGGKRHVVQPGDTLSNLSRQYFNTPTRWREIYEANHDVLKSEKDKLVVGMELKIP